MKIWVDDERPAPDDSWAVATSGGAAIVLIGMHAGDLEEVSLDHDLGKAATGYDVLRAMSAEGWWPKVLTIHTSNPPARKRMLALANAESPESMEIYVITDHLNRG